MPKNALESSQITNIDCHVGTPEKEYLSETAVTSINDAYEVLKELGRGRFAKVVAVRHRGSGEVSAAKLQRWRRFCGSGRSMKTIVDTELGILRLAHGHPSFVQLRRCLATPQESVILLETCQGGSLQDAVIAAVADDVPEDQLQRHAEFCRQAAGRLLAGLQFLHDRRMCHLDVKPCNLLLRRPYPDCDLCLCDFGLVKRLGDSAAGNVTMDGTPDYAAPEVLNYEPISTAVDMWSAGAVIFFVATAVSPFAPALNEPKEVVYSRVATAGCDWSLLGGHECEPLVRRLLVKEVEHRLTADEALKQEYLQQLQQPPQQQQEERTLEQGLQQQQ